MAKNSEVQIWVSCTSWYLTFVHWGRQMLRLTGFIENQGLARQQGEHYNGGRNVTDLNCQARKPESICTTISWDRVWWYSTLNRQFSFSFPPSPHRIVHPYHTFIPTFEKELTQVLGRPKKSDHTQEVKCTRISSPCHPRRKFPRVRKRTKQFCP